MGRIFSQNKFTSTPALALQRVRLRVGRSAEGAGLSHLQQIDGLRRALIASGWPVSQTEGKRPKIKASFGPAVSVGYESDAEYVDIEMVSRLDLKKAGEMLAPHLPAGYSFIGVKSIPRFFPSLEETVNAASFDVRSPVLAGTSAKWEEFFKKEHFPVIKKKEAGDVVIDARPLVRSWSLEGELLQLVIRFGPGRTLKPERIVQAVLGLEEEKVQMGTPTCVLSVRRKQFYMEKQTGELSEP